MKPFSLVVLCATLLCLSLLIGKNRADSEILSPFSKRLLEAARPPLPFLLDPQSLLCAADLAAAKDYSAGENIQLMAVRPTPEPGAAMMVIQVPKDGKVVGGNPVWIQARIDGYTLGGDSQFDRAWELVNSKKGQSLRIVIDDEPAFAAYGPAMDPFNEQGWYYDQFFRFEVPFSLKKGFHTIRAFLTRSFGESLKGNKVYFASYFFVGEKEDASEAAILNQPYLTYNEPSNLTPLSADKPVLLDFYLSNVDLSPDGYKVKMTLDNKTERIITSWQPYSIHGLKKGKHTLRLELIDRKNSRVPGPWNDVEREFTIR